MAGPKQLTGDAWAEAWQRDIRAVVAEAGLPSSVTDSLMAAAQKGHISDNPGILLYQVSEVQVGCWLVKLEYSMQLVRCSCCVDCASQGSHTYIICSERHCDVVVTTHEMISAKMAP